MPDTSSSGTMGSDSRTALPRRIDAAGSLLHFAPSCS
jgi:hypothetical protein